jgi:hypothetical protein
MPGDGGSSLYLGLYFKKTHLSPSLNFRAFSSLLVGPFLPLLKLCTTKFIELESFFELPKRARKFKGGPNESF